MALTSKQIAEFYVVLFNRAAENSGLNYWRNLNLDDIKTINLMLDTQAAKDYFKGTVDDNKAFVELIYKNSLGKTSKEDKAGVDYWTNLLNKGTTRGEIVKGIVAAAKDPANVAKDPVAAKTFANKIEISEYFASKVKNVLKDKDGKFNFSKFQDVLKSTNDKNLADQKKAIDEIASKEPIDNQVDPIVEPKPNPNPGNEGGATPPPPPPQAKADLISDADGFFKLNGIDVKLKGFDKVYFKDDKYYKSAEISPANEIAPNSVVAEMKNEKISIVFDTEDPNNPTIADAKLGFSASLKKEVDEQKATVNAKSYSDISSILLDVNVSKVIKSLTIDEPITDENLTQLVTLGIKNGVVVAKMSAVDILAIKDAVPVIKLLKDGSLTIANPTKDDVATIKAILAEKGLAAKIDPKDPALKIDGVLDVPNAPMTVEDFESAGASMLGKKDVVISNPEKEEVTVDQVKALVNYKQALKEGEFAKLKLTTKAISTEDFAGLNGYLDVVKSAKIMNNTDATVKKFEYLKFIIDNKEKVDSFASFKVNLLDEVIDVAQFNSVKAHIKDNPTKVEIKAKYADIVKWEGTDAAKISKITLDGKLTNEAYSGLKNITSAKLGANIKDAELDIANAKEALLVDFIDKFEDKAIDIVGKVSKNDLAGLTAHKDKFKDNAIKDLVLDNNNPETYISNLGAKLADNSVTFSTAITLDNVKALIDHIKKIKDGAIDVKNMELESEKATALADASSKLSSEATIQSITGDVNTEQAIKLMSIKDNIIAGAVKSLKLKIGNVIQIIKGLGDDISDGAIKIDDSITITGSDIKNMLDPLSGTEKLKLAQNDTFANVKLAANEIEFAKNLGEMLKDGAIKKITGKIDVELSKVLNDIHEKLSANNVIADSITLEKDHLSNLKDKIASTATVTVEKAKDDVEATAGNDTLKLDATVKDATNLAITNFNATNDKIDFTALGMNAEKDVAENSAVAPETRITLENGKIYLFDATAADAAGLINNFGDGATHEFSTAFSDGIAIILAKKDGSTWNVFKVEDKDGNDIVEVGDVTLLGTITPDAALTLDNIIVG